MTGAGNAFAELDEETYHELLRLTRYYRHEAEKCEEAKAYLMGCCAIAAALEAALLCITHLYPEDVLDAPSVPKHKGVIKPLLDWKLDRLVRVAREVGWLPAGLKLNEEWRTRKAKIGDHVFVLKVLRNLVHPAAYVRDHAKKRVTARYLKHAFGVVDVAISHLEERNAEALRKAMKEEEEREKATD